MSKKSRCHKLRLINEKKLWLKASVAGIELRLVLVTRSRGGVLVLVTRSRGGVELRLVLVTRSRGGVELRLVLVTRSRDG